MPLSLVDQMGPSGYAALPPDVVLVDRTGQAAVSAEILPLDGLLSAAPREGSTGDPALQMSLVAAVLGSRDVRRSITSYRNPLIIEAPASVSVVEIDDDFPRLNLVVRTRIAESVEQGRPREHRPRPSAAPMSPAEELRSVSGLPPALLAQLFGVSRTAYYKWIEGATPRDERFQHLVDVLSHMKDARRRLSASIDFTSWLRTPIAPGAKPPIEYLRDSKFTVFRGLVLRAASAPMPLVTSSIPSQPMSAAERTTARERISPSPRVDDDEG